MSAVFENVLRECGKENMGGFKSRLLFYPACSMETVPTLIANPAAMADYATADGTFEFKDPANKPVAIYATDKTVGMKSDNQGELDGQSFLTTGEFFHPGKEVEVGGFARLVNNTPGYLVLENAEGDQYIVGQPGLPCNIKPSHNSGTGRADRRGFAFTFEADSYAPFIKLKTPINMDDYFNPVTNP